MKIILYILIFTVIIMAFVVVYQGLAIHKLKIKSDNTYNQFIYNKESLMDSVRINNKTLSLIQQKISKLKLQIQTQQKPTYYQMNQQEIQEYMSFILGKYSDDQH